MREKRNKGILQNFSYKLIGMVLLMVPTSARAYWLGDPTTYQDLNKYTIDLIFDAGQRDIFERYGKGFLRYSDGQQDRIEPNRGSPIRLKNRRLYMQYRAGLGGYGQGFVRILPNTGRINFENSQYNPHVFGGGVGVQFSPKNSLGLVRIGILASWDWNYGIEENRHSYPSQKLFSEDITTTTRRDEINWTDGIIAVGISYMAVNNLRVYGGITYFRTKVFLELGNEHQTNWRLDRTGGGFIGLNWTPFKQSPRLILALEKHFWNENVLGVSVQYCLHGH